MKPVGPVKVTHLKGKMLINFLKPPASEYAWMYVKQSFIDEEGEKTKRIAKFFGLYQHLELLQEGDILPGKIIILESLTPFDRELDRMENDLKISAENGVVPFSIDLDPIYRKTYYDSSGQMKDEYLEHDNEDEICQAREVFEDFFRRSKITLNPKNNSGKYLLFFDTETTGLPKNWKASILDFDNWPRLVQLAYLIYDFDGNLIEEGNHIIKPEGFKIPYDAEKVHGISTEKALQQGEQLELILDQFNKRIEKAEILVAHNMSYDEKIIGCEMLRTRREILMGLKKQVCTMEESTEYCRIPGHYGYKWPQLSELHYILFSEPCVETHNAAVDIKYTADCFWELIRRGVITI
jgi:DNA polymerase III epsilon subunit-like protein